ncbi:hypothetical protein [Providencia sp. SP181]|uniref:hypothetical protein n=1 Tax=Providencia sp. SP181 TaxID=3136277 RepID=UPI003D2DFDED
MLKKLREQPELKKSRGGYLGFSQAGWVVPQASQLTTTEFAVLIGAAINWRDQSIYYTGQRIKFEGRYLNDIQDAKKMKQWFLTVSLQKKQLFFPALPNVRVRTSNAGIPWLMRRKIFPAHILRY